MMPGLAPVLSLPGDRMFQATEVAGGHQRPAIIHAYGGAKAGMERSLASIAPEGWIPMAAPMLGTVDKPPMWASFGLRPVVGTTIDFRVLPPILSEREKLLMLSCWQQWDATSVPNSALSQWLVGIDVEHGPDGRSSPTFLKQNFNGQEAADLYQAVHLHTLEDLAEQGPYPKVISQFALRIITYEYPLEAILAIYFLSVTGHLPDKFPHDHPQLIVTPPTDHTLHLLHYEADQLCVWRPGEHQLDQLQIRYTYVSTEGPAYKEHFGAKEHNYSHWLSLNHTAGWWDLARFLFVNPEAACSAKRDATPLRLLSWLSFRLEPSVDEPCSIFLQWMR